jgi:hypothetical protein
VGEWNGEWRSANGDSYFREMKEAGFSSRQKRVKSSKTVWPNLQYLICRNQLQLTIHQVSPCSSPKQVATLDCFRLSETAVRVADVVTARARSLVGTNKIVKGGNGRLMVISPLCVQRAAVFLVHTSSMQPKAVALLRPVFIATSPDGMIATEQSFVIRRACTPYTQETDSLSTSGGHSGFVIGFTFRPIHAN